MRRSLTSGICCLLFATAATAQLPVSLPAVPPPAGTPAPACCTSASPLLDTACCADSRAESCCGPAFWVSGEYLYWVTQGSGAPPLVTTSPPGTVQANAGVLGTSGVREVFPAGRLNNDWQSGFRVSAGTWLDGKIGVSGSFFYLADQDDDFVASSPGTTI